jgi:hypothetical protein
VPGEAAEPRPVDLRLRLLDPGAELERLGHQRDAPAQEHLVGVARAVADGQDGDVGGDPSRAGHQPAQAAVGGLEVLQAAGETDLAAELLELAPQGADDQGQAVGAEVRAVLVENRGLAVAVGQDLQDAPDVGPGAAAGQLAVAEGAGAPLAEEVVALRVQRPPGVEAADVGDAVLDLPAAFQDQGAVALERQEIAGEQPRGARADDDRAMGQGLSARLGPFEAFGDERRDVGSQVAPRQAGLVARQLHLGRVDEPDLVVPPGVEALAQDPPAGDRVGAPRRAARPASRAGWPRARPGQGGCWRSSATSYRSE